MTQAQRPLTPEQEQILSSLRARGKGDVADFLSSSSRSAQLHAVMSTLISTATTDPEVRTLLLDTFSTYTSVYDATKLLETIDLIERNVSSKTDALSELEAYLYSLIACVEASIGTYNKRTKHFKTLASSTFDLLKRKTHEEKASLEGRNTRSARQDPQHSPNRNASPQGGWSNSCPSSPSSQPSTRNHSGPHPAEAPNEGRPGAWPPEPHPQGEGKD